MNDLEKSFSSAFEVTCRLLESLGYGDGERLRSLLGQYGAVGAAKHCLAVDTTSPGFVELWAHDQVDLSVEGLVLRDDFRALYSGEEISIARARVASTGSPQTGEMSAADAQPSTSPEPSASFFDRGSGEAIFALELFTEEPLPRDGIPKLVEMGIGVVGSPQVRRHLVSCHECSSRYPGLLAAYQEFDRRCIEALRALLVCIHRVSDTGQERGRQILRKQKCPEGTIEEFELLDLPRSILAWRAIEVAKKTGELMRRLVSTYSDAPDTWLNWRFRSDASAPGTFATSLVEDEFVQLLFALEVESVYEESVRFVWSDDDVPHFPGWLEPIPFPEWSEWQELMDGRSPELDFRNLLTCCQAAARLKLIQIAGETKEGSVRGFLAPIVDLLGAAADVGRLVIHQSEGIAYENRRLRLEIEELQRKLGPRKIGELESSVRKAMGTDVFSNMTSGARPALLHAGYLLHMGDCPDPAQIVASLSLAFERQLREHFFRPLAYFLKNAGTKDYPLGERSILRDGEFQERRLTLGGMRQLFEKGLPESETVCVNSRIQARTVVSALSRVHLYRNKAVHEGNFSFAMAKCVRDELLGVERPESSVFRVFLPS